MTTPTSVAEQLKELIDSGYITVKNKFIGCCMRSYIQLPKSKHRYYYNSNKSLSKKLEKKFSTYNIYHNMKNDLNRKLTPEQRNLKRVVSKIVLKKSNVLKKTSIDIEEIDVNENKLKYY